MRPTSRRIHRRKAVNLKSPCCAVSVSRPDISELEVVLPMRRLATMWQQLFPIEECRLAQLLIERMVVADGGLRIVWRDQGWQELAVELMPGTIGAELQELEETA